MRAAARTLLAALALLLDRPRLGALVELTKPRLTSLAVVAALCGYYLGLTGPADWVRVLAVLLGSSLIGGGANALNQFIERDLDARMRRTRDRPLPSGRLDPSEALLLGTALSVAGVGVLLMGVHAMAAWLAVATLVSYLFIYTPLKRRTVWNTLIGAVPGALPVLIGWSAARTDLPASAWCLFAIVVCWQLPHFFAICRVYRRDYLRAGYAMFPLRDARGVTTGVHTTVLCAVLILLSTSTTWAGLTGTRYVVGAVVLGIGFLLSALWMAVRPGRTSARVAFFASIVYLPLLLGLMMLDKTGG